MTNFIPSFLLAHWFYGTELLKSRIVINPFVPNILFQTLRFPDVFREQSKGALGTNGLKLRSTLGRILVIKSEHFRFHFLSHCFPILPFDSSEYIGKPLKDSLMFSRGVNRKLWKKLVNAYQPQAFFIFRKQLIYFHYEFAFCIFLRGTSNFQIFLQRCFFGAHVFLFFSSYLVVVVVFKKCIQRKFILNIYFRLLICALIYLYVLLFDFFYYHRFMSLKMSFIILIMKISLCYYISVAFEVKVLSLNM